ncbi:hypothetical protein [Mucilaginibacter celer]|uniref:Uncharacterized protein n=1 Tax=Mucilaginibacter celer TaxID=2305508 RepID=A0A494VSF3_9SPHI|nr:hypothetical protein [Mucilaginibacter celer]AYL98536.1 hypothetical protein HYN43_026080 [Mucilaginibacter celer]
MKYFLLYIPLVLFLLSYGYSRRYYRLIHYGRATDIIQANQRSKQFITLAVLSVIFLAVIKLL